MQMQKIQNGARAQLHRNVIIEGVTALPQAHKTAQTRQSHESPLRPLPPEQRSRTAMVRVLIVAVLVFRGTMEVDPLLHHCGAAVAVPEVDDSGWFVTLKTLFDHLVGIRIHSAAGASWANIAHLRV